MGAVAFSTERVAEPPGGAAVFSTGVAATVVATGVSVVAAAVLVAVVDGGSAFLLPVTGVTAAIPVTAGTGTGVFPGATVGVTKKEVTVFCCLAGAALVLGAGSPLCEVVDGGSMKNWR